MRQNLLHTCTTLLPFASQGQGLRPSQSGDYPGGGLQAQQQQQQQQQQQPDGGSGAPASLSPGHPNHDQMQRFYAQQQAARGGGGGSNASAPAAQSPSAVGSPGSKPGVSAAGQPDRFGLLGLLSVIRMTDPDLTTLALGTDLTTLGLNLNSPDNLHKTFASPWADGPLKAEPDFKVRIRGIIGGDTT